MLRRLSLCTTTQPDLFVAENKADVQQAEDVGLPYIVRPRGVDDDTLIKAIMLPVMKKLIPTIDWDKWFNEETGKRVSNVENIVINVPGGSCEAENLLTPGSDDSDLHISDSAEEERGFNCGYEVIERKRKLYEWLDDENSSVDIDYLMSMELMPAFCLDITKAIEKNLMGYDWSDGYNKKLGMCLGNYDTQKRARNLLIIDVSGSIPRNISATMLTLAATLRERMNAELIITGSNSMYWGLEDELPSPEWIRDHIGYANESWEFSKILKSLAGAEYANVICFGDEDTPYFYDPEMKATTIHDFVGTPIIVHNLLSFHTRKLQTPGYAKWLKEMNKDNTSDFYEKRDTKWCKVIRK